MTSQPSPALVTARRSLCWLFILIALVAGILIGRYVLYSRGGPRGNCVRPDTSIAASGVTASECQRTCPECTWEAK
jgi:hypothetical protein